MNGFVKRRLRIDNGQSRQKRKEESQTGLRIPGTDRSGARAGAGAAESKSKTILQSNRWSDGRRKNVA